MQPGDSERLAVHQSLLRQIEAIVDESGDCAGFNAAAWLAQWLTEPLPALGGVAPATFMGMVEGEELVASALAKVHSGAYA